MAYENIIFEIEGDVAVIKFNRPKALNAINIDVVKDIQKALDEVESNPSVRVLILTGEGDKAFVAGADISLMVNLTPLQLREFSVALHELGFRMEGLSIPAPWHLISFMPPRMPNSASPRLTSGSSPVSAGPSVFQDWLERGWQRNSA